MKKRWPQERPTRSNLISMEIQLSIKIKIKFIYENTTAILLKQIDNIDLPVSQGLNPVFVSGGLHGNSRRGKPVSHTVKHQKIDMLVRFPDS